MRARQTSQQLRKRAERLVEQRLDALAGEACQHRRGAAARDRDHQRRAIDDGRDDEAGALGIVDDVAEQVAGTSRRRDALVQRDVVGSGHHQRRAFELRFVEFRGNPERRERLGADFAGDHGDAGTGVA